MSQGRDKERQLMARESSQKELLSHVLKYPGISKSGKYDQFRQSHEGEKCRVFLKN